MTDRPRPADAAPRRALRVVLSGVAVVLVAGILGMHGLSASTASLGAGPAIAATAPDVAADQPRHGLAAGASTIESGTVAAASVTAAAAGPVGHAVADECAAYGGTCGLGVGACLALLGGVLLWVLARARFRALRASLPRPDALAALAVSLATRARPAARPDLHALSILRC